MKDKHIERLKMWCVLTKTQKKSFFLLENLIYTFSSLFQPKKTYQEMLYLFTSPQTHLLEMPNFFSISRFFLLKSLKKIHIQ